MTIEDLCKRGLVRLKEIKSRRTGKEMVLSSPGSIFSGMKFTQPLLVHTEAEESEISTAMFKLLVATRCGPEFARSLAANQDMVVELIWTYPTLLYRNMFTTECRVVDGKDEVINFGRRDWEEPYTILSEDYRDMCAGQFYPREPEDEPFNPYECMLRHYKELGERLNLSGGFEARREPYSCMLRDYQEISARRHRSEDRRRKNQEENDKNGNNKSSSSGSGSGSGSNDKDNGVAT